MRLAFLLFAVMLPMAAAGNWQEVVRDRVPLYGHRNWIVIADSAYPAQSREGVETVVADAGQLEVTKFVLSALAASKHARPIVYTDMELSYVDEDDAPGVRLYRSRLADLIALNGDWLGSTVPRTIPHEEMIAKLDDAARTFRVLIIKTHLAIPYTSVFLQIDCAYWNAEAEKKLRAAMGAKP